MTVGIHLCRGNNQGKWLGEGDYEYVAARASAGLAVDAYFLEYDTPRRRAARPSSRRTEPTGASSRTPPGFPPPRRGCAGEARARTLSTAPLGCMGVGTWTGF